MENPKNPTARNLPDAGSALYTRSGERSSTGYAALMEGAALVDLSHRTVLRLSGRDPVGMLNAVLTNEVPEEPDLGTYALLLDPKGRIQADLRVVKVPPGREILLGTERAGTAAAKELLGRYAPFSHVMLEDLSHSGEPWGVLGLYGPRAKELLSGIELAEHVSAAMSPGGAPVLAAGVVVPVAGYDFLAPANVLTSVRERILEGGATLADADAYETARIAAGVPRFGADITPENFPAEAGILDRAVSFEKGCYPGQETVARMHYRGHPNRTLHRFAVEGSTEGLRPGAPIFQNGKRVGSITSLAPLPVSGEILALGYLHRNADSRGELRSEETMLRCLTPTER
jgi:tRNA-modifying protein YgfZ